MSITEGISPMILRIVHFKWTITKGFAQIEKEATIDSSSPIYKYGPYTASKNIYKKHLQKTTTISVKLRL